MTARLQYPVWAATDPTSLGDVQRDEIAWWRPLSEPVRRPVDISGIPSVFFDPVTIDAGPAEIVTLDEFRPLSQPVARHPVRQPDAAIIDPVTLGGAAAEIITLDEFRALSQPVVRRPVRQPDAAIIDPATLDAPLRDEIQWWRDLDLPVRRRPNLASVQSFTTDPTELGATAAAPTLHRAEQIMAAVETAITGLTTTGANAFRGRAYPLTPELLPGLVLRQGEDEIVAHGSGDQLIARLALRIEAAAGETTTNIETALDAIYSEIVVALMADRTLGLSFVDNTIEIVAAQPEITGAGDRATGILETEWHVLHRRSRLDPAN